MSINLRQKVSEDGFTIIEVIVSVALLALALIALGTLVVTLQTAKRNNDATSNAVYAMRIVNENIRTGYVYSLNGSGVNLCGFVQDLTGSLQTSNLTNGRGTATFSCVDGVYGVRRVDTVIYFDIGNVTKSIQASTYVGNGGLYQ